MADPAFAASFAHMRPPVRVLYGINRVYIRSFHNVRVASPCPMPARGGGILICNHTGGIDPFILQATCPRFLTWMMAKEYYELPVLGPICQKLGYIPVNRSGRDTASLKASLRALSAGQMLGVFPEGRIAATHALMPFQPGVAMMAARAGVPVYPAYIHGMRRNMSVPRAFVDPQDITIRYGQPITVGKDLAAATEALFKSVDTLRKQSIAGRLPRRCQAPNDQASA